jgi:hypothetical protein
MRAAGSSPPGRRPAGQPPPLSITTPDKDESRIGALDFTHALHKDVDAVEQQAGQPLLVAAEQG